MACADYNEHTEPLFHDLNLLTLHDIYELEIAKFMFKYVNFHLPEPLSNIYTSTNIIHEHHTIQHNDLRPSINRLNTSLQSVLYKGPIVWNSLPQNITQLTTLPSFIYKLRTKLLSE